MAYESTVSSGNKTGVSKDLILQNWHSAIFGVSGTVGFGGEEALTSGNMPRPILFNGDASSPYADPKAVAQPPKTINAALSQLYNLPKDQMINWKNRLYDAGLYDPGMYSKGLKPRQIGVLDSSDQEAFRQLILTSASAPTGATVQDVLTSLQEDSPYSSKNNYGKQAYQSTATTADPATIRKYAQTAAQELLGRDLTPDEENRLTAKLSAQEVGNVTAAANKAAAMQASGQGGVVISQNVDVNARAEQEIEASNAAEVEAKKFAGGYDVLMKMIGAGQ